MRPKTITSRSNADFQLCRSLLTAKGLKEHGLALFAGSKVIPELNRQFPGQISAMICAPDHDLKSGLDFPIWQFSDPLFKELDVAGTHLPLMVVKIPEIKAWSDQDPWPKGCTLFLPFQNPDNIGAVVRSASAFDVSRIVLLAEAAHPFHPKSMRAAGTALLQVPLFRGPSINDLEVTKVPAFILAMGGVSLTEALFPETFAILAGLEGQGIPDHLRFGNRLSIPMENNVESLNAATSIAIALYVWRQTPTMC